MLVSNALKVSQLGTSVAELAIWDALLGPHEYILKISWEQDARKKYWKGSFKKKCVPRDGADSSFSPSMIPNKAKNHKWGISDAKLGFCNH